MKFLFLLLLFACGRPAAWERATFIPEAGYIPSDEMRDQRAWYLEATKLITDPVNGFSDTDKCDSLLHSGLLGAGGMGVLLEDARNDAGQWFRRPLNQPECLATGASKSTISRDMLLGVMFWAWKNQDRDILDRLWGYGDTHGWRMGGSDGSIDGWSRVWFTPNLQALLAELIFRLHGHDHWQRHIPVQYGTNLTGYQLHLDIIDLILWYQATGQYTVYQLSVLDGYAAQHPSNALIQYAVGNYSLADKLIRMHHPFDHLPTSADMCSPMAYEKATLEPCPDEGRTHAPIHFLLISRLLLEI